MLNFRFFLKDLKKILFFPFFIEVVKISPSFFILSTLVDWAMCFYFQQFTKVFASKKMR